MLQRRLRAGLAIDDRKRERAVAEGNAHAATAILGFFEQ
jgi:hypothetical protein